MNEVHALSVLLIVAIFAVIMLGAALIHEEKSRIRRLSDERIKALNKSWRTWNDGGMRGKAPDGFTAMQDADTKPNYRNV